MNFAFHSLENIKLHTAAINKLIFFLDCRLRFKIPPQQLPSTFEYLTILHFFLVCSFFFSCVDL